MGAEWCLVEFFALEMKRAGGFLRISRHDTVRKYEKNMPTMLAEFINSKFKGSLTQFFRFYKDVFVFCDDKVGLLPYFEARSILMHTDNLSVVQFFLDLLQKIGATREQPCPVHILSKYIQYMDHDTRLFLHKMYGNSLNVFFTLNHLNFHMTSPDRGFVSLRQYPAASNCIAAHLRKCLHKSDAFNSSSGLNIEELLHKATMTWLPELRLYFGDANRTSKLNNLLDSYPNVFKWRPHEKVWLRRKYERWDKKWSSADELLAAIHFMELLKDIGATLSNPICFNYILCSVESVPKECSAYISHVFPGIDLIDLFHLHPDKFDLSTTNCVSLKCGDREIEMKKSPDALSAYYAAQLLKYAPNLTPDTLRICIEKAPKVVKSYCATTVRHRLHTVLDSGRELLTSGVVDRTMAADLLTSICSTSVLGANHGEKNSKNLGASTAANTPLSMQKKATTKPSKKSKTSTVAEQKQSVSHLQTTASVVPSLTSASLAVFEKVRPQNTLAEALTLTEMKLDASAMDTLKRSKSYIDTTTLVIQTPTSRSLTQFEELKLQNALPKALSLNEQKQDTAALDTPKRSQAQPSTSTLITPAPNSRSWTESEGLKMQNSLDKPLSMTELEQNVMLLTPTARNGTLSEELNQQSALPRATSLNDLVQGIAVSDTLKRSQSHVDTSMLIIPTPTARTLTESPELKLQNTVAKAISLTELEQGVVASDGSKRSHSLPSAPYSKLLPSQLTAGVADGVTRLKKEDGRSEIPIKTMSNPCLIASKSRELVPLTEKCSSCLELHGDEPMHEMKTVSLESTNALSLAGWRQQPKEHAKHLVK